MTTRVFNLLALISVLFSCTNEAPVQVNKFSDAAIQKISEFKDRRQSDSLYRFLIHPDPLYRKDAALAFASVQDSLAIHHLGKLLIQEKDTMVRSYVAFAIGQTPSRDSERILLAAIIKERNATVLSELMEAYGRATTHWQLINPAFFHDTVKAEGLAWSIYRAGLNGKTDSTANRVASDLLSQEYNFRTRLGAAHYFSRSAKDFQRQLPAVINSATKDPAPEVRMAATYSLRKIKTAESLESLKNILDSEKDPGIRVNAVRALQNFDFAETRSTLVKALRDKHRNVGIAASEVLKTLGTEENWVELANLTTTHEHWRIRSNLYEGALKASRAQTIADEITVLYNDSANPYEKAALLAALQHNLPSLDFIEQEFIKARNPVIRTAAASTLANYNYDAGFTPTHKDRFIALVKQAVSLGDPPAIATLVTPIADPKLKYNEVLKDVTFLKSALKEMSLPQDFEAIEPLEKALAYLEGTEPGSIENVYNHPIDWDHVKTIPRDQVVVIKTSRGHIKVRLFVEEAPGSVSNFLKLARNNYFDKKLFHRVVPNFVIQGGCKRGDGSGSENYSIRSEFSHRRYLTGSVGMASSGKDTEGTQWFITHSPTPHLDGRYTLFGEVIDGMEVVNLIELGDVINSIQVK